MKVACCCEAATQAWNALAPRLRMMCASATTAASPSYPTAAASNSLPAGRAHPSPLPAAGSCCAAAAPPHVLKPRADCAGLCACSQPCAALAAGMGLLPAQGRARPLQGDSRVFRSKADHAPQLTRPAPFKEQFFWRLGCGMQTCGGGVSAQLTRMTGPGGCQAAECREREAGLQPAPGWPAYAPGWPAAAAGAAARPAAQSARPEQAQAAAPLLAASASLSISRFFFLFYFFWQVPMWLQGQTAAVGSGPSGTMRQCASAAAQFATAAVRGASGSTHCRRRALPPASAPCPSCCTHDQPCDVQLFVPCVVGGTEEVGPALKWTELVLWACPGAARPTQIPHALASSVSMQESDAGEHATPFLSTFISMQESDAGKHATPYLNPAISMQESAARRTSGPQNSSSTCVTPASRRRAGVVSAAAEPSSSRSATGVSAPR